MKKKTKTKPKSAKKSPKKSVSKSPKTANVKTPLFSIQPLADRVVVRPFAEEASLRPSGIYIPETAEKERPSQGTVVAVGPGGHQDGDFIPMSVKVGDVVMFSKYGYDEVKVAGEEYYIVKEENILGIIN